MSYTKNKEPVRSLINTFHDSSAVFTCAKVTLYWTIRIKIKVKGICARFHMMTLSNGNIFRVTGLLCGEFIGHRWIPRIKASDADLWCFFYLKGFTPKPTVEQTIGPLVIWDATALIMTSLYWIMNFLWNESRTIPLSIFFELSQKTPPLYAMFM